MDVVNPVSGVFPPRIGSEIQRPPVAAEVPATVDGMHPVATGAPVVEQVPANQPSVEQPVALGNVAKPEVPISVDLGTPIAVGNEQPVTSNPAEPSAPAAEGNNEVTPAEAVKGSFTAGEHGVLEETVAQSPIDERVNNIGDVSVSDAIQSAEPAQPAVEQPIKPAQPAVEQPIEPAQPPETPAPVSSVGPVEDVGEAAPPPFIITPEESVPEPAEIVPPAETTTPPEPITPIDRVTTAPATPAAIVEEPVASPSNVAEKAKPPVTPEELAEIRNGFLNIIDEIDKRTGELRAAVAEKLDRAA